MKGQTDNQQRKVSESDMAWLAGFIDGEGTVGIKVANNRNGHIYFAPYVQIVNTHFATLDKVHQVLTDMQVGHHISEAKRHLAPNGKMKLAQYRPLWRVLINGLMRCKSFLIPITPLFVTKRQDAETVIDFINSRESSYYKQLPYSNYELELVNRFRRKRHSGRPTKEIR